MFESFPSNYCQRCGCRRVMDDREWCTACEQEVSVEANIKALEATSRESDA